MKIFVESCAVFNYLANIFKQLIKGYEEFIYEISNFDVLVFTYGTL